ncbi:bifunctional SulP family inorganic anion transporter/carbonic anhydrase [Gimesia fumaroli]|uniref:Carbonic anhydrase 2 n=1 Tax=Gimesia fumaroli TaxID=2527976 RepID=A0A518IHL0_9PLAN|nr:SulP family inorganic anion transporter [Gimesia fumaroli]QDV52584.1 Carbonic anhydrase 2 [Gimesia fumaroli]
MDEARLSSYPISYLPRDLTSGLVVFLVALPLCLGIALASGAPLFSGILAGIIGGIIVGSISGSSTSVSGPAAGLTAIVIAQIAALGSFEAFLLAVMIGGILQIGLGIVRAGSLSAFFPSSVIKGLLAAIGVILILKQIPHILGHDTDPEGEMSFTQPDKQNTFSEILTLFEGDIHFGAAVVGIMSIVLLTTWGRVKLLKNSVIPGPLVVVLLGVSLHLLFQRLGGPWAIEASHLVQIPVAESANDLLTFLKFPDFSQWANPAIYLAGVTIAIVASLETLLNLEAVDKLDPENRNSPASRELVAQGVGNMVSGLVGGLPVTSVIVRGSVNVNSGAKTKVSCIFHGVLLLICVGLFPVYLNMIPLAALAAILFVTGFKLASPALFRQMWKEGRYQFAPFLITLLSIVFTDLLTGILIGLGVSVLFILNSSLRQPIRRIVETHLGGDILHIELANQVSFLNRAALDQLFNEAEPGIHMLIDASDTDYIDPDILSLIQEYKTKIGPARGVSVSLRGFRKKYQLHDEIQFADFSTRELQDRVTAEQVLEILREGNRRFYTGNRLSRDLGRQVNATAGEQNPIAVVLSCIDSRVPAELVLDLGIGDIFSVRVAGNVIGNKSLGSIEYGVAVAGVKLVLVLGHTRCGAVTSTVELMCDQNDTTQVTGCSHLDSIVNELVPCVDEEACEHLNEMTSEEQELFIDEVARRNVYRSVHEITARSKVIRDLVEAGKVMVVGALYDVKSGEMEFFTEQSAEQETEESPQA